MMREGKVRDSQLGVTLRDGFAEKRSSTQAATNALLRRPANDAERGWVTVTLGGMLTTPQLCT